MEGTSNNICRCLTSEETLQGPPAHLTELEDRATGRPFNINIYIYINTEDVPLAGACDVDSTSCRPTSHVGHVSYVAWV